MEERVNKSDRLTKNIEELIYLNSQNRFNNMNTFIFYAFINDIKYHKYIYKLLNYNFYLIPNIPKDVITKLRLKSS